jgi:hypothetical protein
MMNGGSTAPFPQTREGREGWGSTWLSQVKEKQVAGSDVWRRRERRALSGDYGRWGTDAGNGAGAAGAAGATETRAKGGGIRLAWPFWAGYWTYGHRPERTVTYLEKFQKNMDFDILK